MMLIPGLAVISGLAGTALLYAAWRKLLSGSFAIPLGWVLLLLSLLLWGREAGTEFGTVYALLCIGLCAWAAIGLNDEIRRHRRQRKDVDKPYVQQALPASHSVLQHVLIFLVAVPLAGIVAILLSVGLAALLPWSRVNALVFTVLLLPVLWGAGSYWVCASDRLWRPTLALVMVGLLSAGLIYG